jgi:hypothetical protein
MEKMDKVRRMKCKEKEKRMMKLLMKIQRKS